jgi:hypothetical protein
MTWSDLTAAVVGAVLAGWLLDVLAVLGSCR